MCDRKSLRDILSLCAVCALRVCAELAAFDAAELFSLAKTINTYHRLCASQNLRLGVSTRLVPRDRLAILC